MHCKIKKADTFSRNRKYKIWSPDWWEFNVKILTAETCYKLAYLERVDMSADLGC